MKMFKYIGCILVSACIIWACWQHGPGRHNRGMLFADVFMVRPWGVADQWRQMAGNRHGKVIAIQNLTINSLPMAMDIMASDDSPAMLLKKIEQQYGAQTLVTTPNFGMAGKMAEGKVTAFVALQGMPGSPTTLCQCVLDSSVFINKAKDIFAPRNIIDQNELGDVPLYPGAQYDLNIAQHVNKRTYAIYDFHAQAHPQAIRRFFKTKLNETGWVQRPVDPLKPGDYYNYVKGEEECFVFIDSGDKNEGCDYTVALVSITK